MTRVRFGIRVPHAWFVGYQCYTDAVGVSWFELFVIPPLALRVGYRVAPWR